MAEQELNLLQFAASRMTQTCARSAQVMGSEVWNSQFCGIRLDNVPDHFLGHPLTPVVPDLHTHLNNLPLVMFAPWNQSSKNRFTHSGTGTVRMCPPFPIKSTMAQWSSRR